MAKVEDYRLRVGHLINAIDELKQAVTLLAARVPDVTREGLVVKVEALTRACDAELAEAGHEL